MHIDAHGALSVLGALPLHMHIAPLGACALCPAPSEAHFSRSQKAGENPFHEQAAAARVGSLRAAARPTKSAKPLPDMLIGHTHCFRNWLTRLAFPAISQIHVITMSSVPLIYTLIPN
jgi:hypothetical protein